jgi:YggT family protein
MIANTIHLLFTCYTAMLVVRIISSWFQQLRQYKFMQFIMYYTDPYLNLFRKIIPPIGGMLDLSPLLAFFALQMLERFLLHLFR